MAFDIIYMFPYVCMLLWTFKKNQYVLTVNADINAAFYFSYIFLKISLFKKGIVITYKKYRYIFFNYLINSANLCSKGKLHFYKPFKFCPFKDIDILRFKATIGINDVLGRSAYYSRQNYWYCALWRCLISMVVIIIEESCHPQRRKQRTER